VEEPAMPNSRMELKVVLLFAASDLRCTAGELAVRTGGKPKATLGLPVQDDAKDLAATNSEELPANIFLAADKLPKPVLEKVRLPPVEQLCVDFEAKLVEMVEEPTL
jgi:hypothetical protein